MTLSRKDIEAFHADGAIALRGVVDAEWLRVLADAIEDDIANPAPFYHGYEPDNGRGRFHGNLRTWEFHDGFRRFCFESPLPELAAGILGSRRINLLYDQLFVKEPGTVNRTRWHNDQPYWPIDGYQVMSFWVALDPTSRPETGAVEFVRGSHRWGRFYPAGGVRPHRNSMTTSGTRTTRRCPISSRQGPSYDIFSASTWNPGDVCAFHALVLHGAGGNPSERVRRRGYAVRYTGNDVTYSTRPGTNRDLRNAMLRDGDALDSAQYPLVWEGEDGP